jgi:methionine-rich copper-binding protein CopC
VALLLGAAPASAHTRLQSSDPADGSSVATGPESVSLVFNEDIGSEFAKISLVGPDGVDRASGPLSASGGTVSTPVSPLGPAGTYTVGYRVVSDDGHPVQGKVTFTLTAPGPAAAAAATAEAAASLQGTTEATAQAAPAPIDAPTQAQTSEDAAPVWPWIAGGVVLVGVGAALALRAGRRG